MWDFLAMETARLEGPLLLAGLLTAFVGGVLVTYAGMTGSAQALYDLLRRPRVKDERSAGEASTEAPRDGDDG